MVGVQFGKEQEATNEVACRVRARSGWRPVGAIEDQIHDAAAAAPYHTRGLQYANYLTKNSICYRSHFSRKLFVINNLFSNRLQSWV
jgi:hypothetical protein